MTDDTHLKMIAEAARRQYEIDHQQAGPKADSASTIHKGIRIESRWSVLHEFDVMRRAIDALPELMSRRLGWMWCDSSCGSCYAVGVKPGLFAPLLKWAINEAFIAANGGHNGIIIEDGEAPLCGATLADLDPDWGEAGDEFGVDVPDQPLDEL